MPTRVKIPYAKAHNLIQEGDVLLFRNHGIISSLIKMAGAGEYSHVAVASRHNGYWEAVEFREWYGGRTVHLENYLKECKKSKNEVDVYRACPNISKLVYSTENESVDYIQSEFNGKAITNCMRTLTGLPYSYMRILLILKIKLFKLHILWDIDKITNEIPSKEIIYPVCSTVLAHCFATNGWPILRRKSDQYTEPSDFSISPRLNYLFTPQV